MSSAPDVRLVGNNTILDFWAREQPANPRIPFSVEIKLLPVRCQIFNVYEVTKCPFVLFSRPFIIIGQEFDFIGIKTYSSTALNTI